MTDYFYQYYKYKLKYSNLKKQFGGINDCAKCVNINPKNKFNFIFVKDRPGHDFRYSLNSSKLKKELKWKCKINLTDGLRKTIYWYIDKFNNNFFKNKNFNNRIGLNI